MRHGERNSYFLRCSFRPPAVGRNPTSQVHPLTVRRKNLFIKTNTVSTLAMPAAYAGLLGGTTARLNAQPTPGQSGATASSSRFAGVLVAADPMDLPKHA